MCNERTMMRNVFSCFQNEDKGPIRKNPEKRPVRKAEVQRPATKRYPEKRDRSPPKIRSRSEQDSIIRDGREENALRLLTDGNDTEPTGSTQIPCGETASAQTMSTSRRLAPHPASCNFSDREVELRGKDDKAEVSAAREKSMYRPRTECDQTQQCSQKIESGQTFALLHDSQAVHDQKPSSSSIILCKRVNISDEEVALRENYCKSSSMRELLHYTSVGLSLAKFESAMTTFLEQERNPSSTWKMKTGNQEEEEENRLGSSARVGEFESRPAHGKVESSKPCGGRSLNSAADLCKSDGCLPPSGVGRQKHQRAPIRRLLSPRQIEITHFG